MPETAREYLMHRFRGDAQSLRDRVDALKGGSNIPGPDAATSARMAEACDQVVHLLERLGPFEDVYRELAALASLVPTLEQMAKQAGAAPPVRAVYAGAATRIREVEAAEAKARASHDHDAMNAAIAEGEDEDDDAE